MCFHYIISFIHITTIPPPFFLYYYYTSFLKNNVTLKKFMLTCFVFAFFFSTYILQFYVFKYMFVTVDIVK
ncbi:uncharacterized protein BX663DRAFT_17941 [Cokeromyces recurvatus]|uniref:uncharacterized protein n=1 Tax=Cokeromyces recurvatus TaxID=90255 RepID=UPI0022200451|nr:uncharacterized protein BX663DRAFT_17941 [Cokeromyces recurvatus]KAI7908026.1 hypothetical protein BX663DRAFT_17941 [Cokeromyces recurvatus]